MRGMLLCRWGERALRHSRQCVDTSKGNPPLRYSYGRILPSWVASPRFLSSEETTRGAVRRAEGFVRYALSFQYHGGSFLGVSYQGPDAEDCVVVKTNRSRKRRKNQTIEVDLRGHRSVEGRLREALDDLFGSSDWDNLQVSSRTDRGVHALKNTLHVDVRVPTPDADRKSNTRSTERKLRDGLNFYLSRQHQKEQRQHKAQGTTDRRNFPTDPRSKHSNFRMHELRILGAVLSPEFMDNTEEGIARGQPHRVDWNARFSATQRTYVYRLLLPGIAPNQNHGKASDGEEEKDDDDDDDDDESEKAVPRSQGQPLSPSFFGIPFEWDRAWCLGHNGLDLIAMQEAAGHLEGTHDFSAFRGRLCQRSSPIVSMASVDVSLHGLGFGVPDDPSTAPRLVTISFVANSFLYRQVRNMVGCLVEVGKPGGRLGPGDVREMLRMGAGGRTSPREPRRYATAPPQGLFLVDVEHGSFRF